MKNLLITIVIFLCVLLFVPACSIVKSINDPEINLNFTVSELTDEEFSSVGTKGLENATKNDFRNVEFTLDVNHTKKITDRKIVMPDIKANLNKDQRYWSGESYSQDNSSENFAKYGEKFVIYSRGLDEQAIRNIFKSQEVKISWTENKKESKEKVYKLDEMIEFKK